MKVFVLTMNWHYETHLMGVFSSPEKAEAEIASQYRDPPEDGSTMTFDVHEMELQ